MLSIDQFPKTKTQKMLYCSNLSHINLNNTYANFSESIFPKLILQNYTMLKSIYFKNALITETDILNIKNKQDILHISEQEIKKAFKDFEKIIEMILEYTEGEQYLAFFFLITFHNLNNLYLYNYLKQESEEELLYQINEIIVRQKKDDCLSKYLLEEFLNKHFNNFQNLALLLRLLFEVISPFYEIPPNQYQKQEYQKNTLLYFTKDCIVQNSIIQFINAFFLKFLFNFKIFNNKSLRYFNENLYKELIKFIKEKYKNQKEFSREAKKLFKSVYFFSYEAKKEKQQEVKNISDKIHKLQQDEDAIRISILPSEYSQYLFDKF